jgi:hypothetical protein
MGKVTGAVHKKENPKAAPAWAYVPTAQGSSLAAPLMSPGKIEPSRDRSRLRGGGRLFFSSRIGPGNALGFACKYDPSGAGIRGDADMK